MKPMMGMLLSRSRKVWKLYLKVLSDRWVYKWSVFSRESVLVYVGVFGLACWSIAVNKVFLQLCRGVYSGDEILMFAG